MKRVLLAALLLLATIPAPATAQDRPAEMPGSYPSEVRTVVEELVEAAEDDAWPSGSLYPEARDRLESARDALEEGRVVAAAEAYVAARREQAIQHTIETASERNPDRGRAYVQSVTDRFLTEGRVAVTAGRTLVNTIDTSNLTVRGAETGVLGTYFLSQGEYQLNLFRDLPSRDVVEGGTVREDEVRSRVSLAVGGATQAAVGAALAGVSPRVPGPSVAQDELEDRLETFANLSVQVPARGTDLDKFPRAQGDEDGPLLRAGVNLLSHHVLSGERGERFFRTQEGDVPASGMRDGLATDREILSPWARAGSPLALAAFEGVNRELPDPVPSRLIGQIASARAFAQTVGSLEQIVSPETTEATDDAPLAPGVGLVALAGAALLRATRRTRRGG